MQNTSVTDISYLDNRNHNDTSDINTNTPKNITISNTS